MRRPVVALALASSFAFAGSVAQAQTLTRLNLGPGGLQANGATGAIKCSADGRYVAFESSATNLVASDTNGAVVDIFVLDRVTGVIELVSRSSAGAQSTTPSTLGGISDDGNKIAFLGNGLEPSGADAGEDVYVRERLLGQTRELTGFNISGAYVGVPTMAGTGQFTCFVVDEMCGLQLRLYNWATSQTVVLASGTTCYNGGNSVDDYLVSADGTKLLYAWSAWQPTGWRQAGLSTVSLPGAASTVVQSVTNGPSGFYYSAKAISNDGQLVVWRVPDTPGLAKGLIAQDRTAGTLTRLDQGALLYWDHASNVSISASKQLVAFVSYSDFLVRGDTNQRRDAFVFDRASGERQRLSLGLNQAQAGQGVTALALDSGFSVALMSSAQADWVAGDTNSVADLFLRDLCFNTYTDADQDGFGAAGSAQLNCLPLPAGRLTQGGDCDDGNSAVNPGAPETPNGIDDDCDGQLDESSSGNSYCVGAPSYAGCTPVLTATGVLSASATSGFQLHVSQANGARFALLQYGIAPAYFPFAPGSGNSSVVCIGAPRARAGSLTLGGTVDVCNGSASTDFLAWVNSHPGAPFTPLVPGQLLHFQAYVRDIWYGGAVLSAGWKVVVTP